MLTDAGLRHEAGRSRILFRVYRQRLCRAANPRTSPSFLNIETACWSVTNLVYSRVPRLAIGFGLDIRRDSLWRPHFTSALLGRVSRQSVGAVDALRSMHGSTAMFARGQHRALGPRHCLVAIAYGGGIWLVARTLLQNNQYYCGGKGRGGCSLFWPLLGALTFGRCLCRIQHSYSGSTDLPLLLLLVPSLCDLLHPHEAADGRGSERSIWVGRRSDGAAPRRLCVATPSPI